MNTCTYASVCVCGVNVGLVWIERLRTVKSGIVLGPVLIVVYIASFLIEMGINVIHIEYTPGHFKKANKLMIIVSGV